MKLTLQGLQEKEQWKNAGIGLPSYDIEKVAEETKKNPVWVHFGAGNIFRIFRNLFEVKCKIVTLYQQFHTG